MDSHPHHGSCSTGEQKIDVQLDALLNSAPVEDSLPARIMAKSREVAAQSGHAAVYSVGMDVGSTTVKAVIVNAQTDEIIWSDYQRHETKQPEKTLEFLKRMQDEVGIAPHNCRIFITGSGGGALANLVGAKFVQEVTAVSLAVEKMHPEVNSVIELGGQDAKIIVFKEDENTGRKKKIPSMNDKCAGGTGAVIDKINAKLKIPTEDLGNQGYTGIKLHPVAGKCGVFAETDINGLQKQGIPPDQLMASLFDAIVLQNLTVLTRGHTLRPHVLLLGGPNSFIRGMKEAWQQNIPKMWEERKVEIPEGAKPEDLIKVPENAQYFAAIGAVEFGKDEDPEVGIYLGTECLEDYIAVGRQAEKAKSGSAGLSTSDEELAQFKQQYTIPKFIGAKFTAGETVQGFIGIDGGSTSTKAVLALGSGRRPVQGLPAFQRQSDPGHHRHVRRHSRAGRVARRDARCPRHGHNRLREGCSERRAEGRRSAGRDRGAHRVGDEVLQEPARHRRRRRTGHQAHRPERRPREGLQAQHAMLGRQRIFPARHCRGVGLQGRAVRRHRLFGEHHADLRLRLRGVHAVGHRQLPAPGLAWRGNPGGTSGGSAQEHLSCTSPAFQTWRSWGRVSSCRAARRRTWRR